MILYKNLSSHIDFVEKQGSKKVAKWQNFRIPFLLKLLLDFEIQITFKNGYFFNSVHSALLTKFSQIIAVKFLLLIYYHSGDQFRAILALLLIFFYME